MDLVTFNKMVSFQSKKKNIVTGVGEVGIPLMVVGFQAEENEATPFSGEIGKIITESFNAIQVTSKMYYATYIIKEQIGRAPDDKQVEFWVEKLKQEIKIIKPNAVVLLGLNAVNAIFNLNCTNIEYLRKKRLIDKRDVDNNFFVTYSAAEVKSKGGLFEKVGNELMSDLIAVCEGDKAYFKIKMVNK